jgi:hypothetical protein
VHQSTRIPRVELIGLQKHTPLWLWYSRPLTLTQGVKLNSNVISLDALRGSGRTRKDLERKINTSFKGGPKGDGLVQHSKF